MPKRECSICHKIVQVPKGENAVVSLSLTYKGKTVDEYEAEVCCHKCFKSLEEGMYSGIERKIK